MLIEEKELIEDISKGTNMKMEENRINKEQSENQEKETFDKKIVEIKSHIEALDKNSAKCPTCGQTINQDQKEKVKDLEAQVSENQRGC